MVVLQRQYSYSATGRLTRLFDHQILPVLLEESIPSTKIVPYLILSEPIICVRKILCLSCHEDKQAGTRCESVVRDDRLIGGTFAFAAAMLTAGFAFDIQNYTIIHRSLRPLRALGASSN